jgi:uncharacterized membrane protein YvbJ
MTGQFVPCPHCGADIDAQAKFCRHCGSSDADGWKEDWEDAGDEDFDYEAFVEENFTPRSTNTQTPVIWRVTALVLLIVFALFLYQMGTQ